MTKKTNLISQQAKDAVWNELDVWREIALDRPATPQPAGDVVERAREVADEIGHMPGGPYALIDALAASGLLASPKADAEWMDKLLAALDAAELAECGTLDYLQKREIIARHAPAPAVPSIPDGWSKARHRIAHWIDRVVAGIDGDTEATVDSIEHELRLAGVLPSAPQPGGQR